jgi:hypothetical protein
MDSKLSKHMRLFFKFISFNRLFNICHNQEF